MNQRITLQKPKRYALILAVLLASAIGTTVHAAASYLLAYPKAGYEISSGIFTLKADNTLIDVVHYYNKYSYAHLAYEGTATFTVSLKSGAAITSFDISPHSYGLDATAIVSGSNLTFSLPQAGSRYLVIKISTSSGTLENLFIAADPQETGVPTIGGNVIDITAAPYNADNTGSTLMTSTIQNSIDDRSAAGGGTVYFPAGIYKIGNNIALKSNVTLYLAAGAVLRGSTNRDDYTWYSGSPPNQGPQNFVINGNVSNVAFKGRGMIDANSTILVGGSGDGFGTYRKGIIASGQSGASRPSNIVIQGITVKDATTWTLNIEDAVNVVIRNVKMLNDYDWVHSDGYDICSCDTALVDNCLAVTGDDAFDAKGTSSNPMLNITYSTCVAFSHRGCGVKIGNQATGVGNGIHFTNIDAVECYRGMSISHDEGSALYTNLYFDKVRVETIYNSGTGGEYQVAPFVFWTYSSGGDGPVNEVSVIGCYIENCNDFKGIIQGNSTNSIVSSVAFQGLKMDGLAITSTNYATKINIGANTTNITFDALSGPPQITAALTWVPSTAYAGQTVRATVAAGGTEPFAYQWQAGLNANYTNLTDGGNISGATTANLTLTDVQSNNALDYIVVITNSLGAITSSVAPLVVLPPLPGQVSVQDGSPLTISHATGTAINQPFTATAGADVMVVTLAEKGARLSEPATLSWNGQTLNRAVQTAYNYGVQRSLAIYYLYNPSPGTANIAGTMTGPTSDTWLTAYTLSGVSTTIAPIAGDVNTGTDSTGVYNLTINLSNVAGGSWAAIAAQYANFPDAVTVTGTGGTSTIITDNNYNVTGVTAGYVAGLSAGAVTLTTTWIRADGPQKANFATLVFLPANGIVSTSTVTAFGIKFLGNTTDAVTTTAGAYPISFWNNIANGSYTSGTIYSSDGSVSATLTRSGPGANNTWKSGIYPDGGNFSLMYGYQDAGINASATNIISGLAGAAYDVYLYTGGDVPRPNSGTDWLPNYTVNGTTYYTATLDGRSAMLKMVQGIPASQNANTYPPSLIAGHYIKIDSVAPVDGKITISANSDNLTYRSPLNGIELVSVGNAPQVMVQPLAHRLYTGGTAQLEVQAEGAAPMSYQWRQNGTNVFESGRIIGSTTNRLTITNLALTDTGDYDVVITNSYGSVTSSVAHLDTVVMSQADAAFEAWIAAYVVTTNGYQTYIVDSLTKRDFAFMWQQAYMIWMIEDTYDRTHSPDQKRLINDLLHTFYWQNLFSLTWDNWDDDLEWGIIALVRGYQITGDVTALNSAIYNWDAVNARGLDDVYDGGIWEKLPAPTSKCALSVCPQIIAGVYLYQITGQSEYLTISEDLYDWGRSNLFIATMAQATNGMALGQVNEGIAWADTNDTIQKVLVSNNSYNSGLFANAACALYEVTGNAQYLSDAILAVNQKVNTAPIANEDHVANGDFGAEQLIRAVSRIASQDNNQLWPAYWPWLQAQCTAAWSKRRTDYNLTWNKWLSLTPNDTNDLDSMESEASVLVQQLTPAIIPGFVNCTNKLSGAVIGTSGSWANSGNTVAKVFDNNFSTFFDGPDSVGDWVGLDLGSSKVIGQINYWPRISFASRMLGGIFQGDNTANFSNPVILSTITVVPPDNGTATTQPIANQTPFRYVRYVGPNNGYCNVAELQFFTTNSPPSPIFLTNSWNGSQLVLNWPNGGLLLEATNVSGPWVTNINASPPFSTTPNQPQKFYRVIVPR